ncbi:MAG: hypothetical protein D3903_17425, partial [Candidatus Electrothrix sp. GM3_4]|nr:hypothetical protein [Candidatus Electrothrix sp. GM3_4]
EHCHFFCSLRDTYFSKGILKVFINYILGRLIEKNNLSSAECRLYKGFEGDKIWTSLSQLAYNLHKFIQLDKSEKIGEESLLKLGLYG